MVKSNVVSQISCQIEDVHHQINFKIPEVYNEVFHLIYKRVIFQMPRPSIKEHTRINHD